MVIHDSLETGDHRSVPQKIFFCYLGQKYLIHIVDFSNIIEAYIKCKQKKIGSLGHSGAYFLYLRMLKNRTIPTEWLTILYERTVTFCVKRTNI